MPESQAEILARGRSDLYERLVTKEHLEQKLRALELMLRNELEKVRADLKNDIEKLRAELKHGLETTKTELKRDIKEMKQELIIKLGAFLVTSAIVLALIIKFV